MCDCRGSNCANRQEIDSEPAFFNYTNHLQAEKRYLLEEALPDWQHKAARLNHEQRHSGTKILFRDHTGIMVDFKTWWSRLKAEVDKWLEDAKDTDIPSFDKTMADYHAFQAKEIIRVPPRDERRSLKIMLELDIPEPQKLDKGETIDSGIGMGPNSGGREYEFTT